MIATMPFLFPIHGDPDDYQRWTAAKLRLELERAGFFEFDIRPMGSVGAVISDLLNSAVRSALRNSSKSIGKRLFARFGLPFLDRIFQWLEQHGTFKNDAVTSGYYCIAYKK